MNNKKARHLAFNTCGAEEPRLFSINPRLDAMDALEQAPPGLLLIPAAFLTSPMSKPFS
jgi:hypothetical protein